MMAGDAKVLIRDAAPDDANAIAGLRLNWERSRAAPTGDEAAYAAAVAAWVASHKETVVGKVAEVDGALVGMAWLAVVDRVPVPTDYDRRSGEVQSVFVQPEVRGTGIGRLLMNTIASEARSRGIRRIVLHSSEEGVAFYRRIGWANVETLLEIEL